MGHLGKIWYWALQKREIARKDQRAGVQKEDEKVTRPTTWRKEEEKIVWTEGVGRVFLTSNWASQGLWPKRKGEKRRIRKENYAIKENARQTSERRVEAKEKLEKERRTTWQHACWKNKRRNLCWGAIIEESKIEVKREIQTSHDLEWIELKENEIVGRKIANWGNSILIQDIKTQEEYIRLQD